MAIDYEDETEYFASFARIEVQGFVALLFLRDETAEQDERIAAEAIEAALSSLPHPSAPTPPLD